MKKKKEEKEKYKNPPHRPTFVDMDWLVHKGKVAESWKEDIIELGKKGKNKTHFANYLNIHRATMYKLMDRDPKLKKIINQALQYSEEWWIEKGREAWENGTSQKLNANFFKYYMSNIYRDTWKTNIDITTDGDKIKQDDKIKIEIIKPIVDEEFDDKEDE